MSANTMGGVVLGNVAEVFTHPFTQCSFSMSNRLFKTYLTSDTIDNVVGFATTVPNGIVIATSNRTFDITRSVQFNAVSAAFFGAEITFVVLWWVFHFLYI